MCSDTMWYTVIMDGGRPSLARRPHQTLPGGVHQPATLVSILTVQRNLHGADCVVQMKIDALALWRWDDSTYLDVIDETSFGRKDLSHRCGCAQLFQPTVIALPQSDPPSDLSHLSGMNLHEP